MTDPELLASLERLAHALGNLASINDQLAASCREIAGVLQAMANVQSQSSPPTVCELCGNIITSGLGGHWIDQEGNYFCRRGHTIHRPYRPSKGL